MWVEHGRYYGPRGQWLNHESNTSRGAVLFVATYWLPLQVEEVRRGLGAVVPLDPLALFSAAELELRVCGEADWSVELLKKNTEIELPRGDPVREFLWQV